MSRARNLKPGFFRNADLAELSVEARLLFAGLWTLADREGRLEDRPKQIKMEIYPADSFDVDALLSKLHEASFIERYQVNGIKYIQVTNFNKHQNPHRDEKASSIPEPSEHGSSTVQAQCEVECSTIPIGLIPDPLNLIPDPGLSDKRAKRATQLPDDFQPNQNGIEYASERKLHIENEINAFKNHHVSKGTTLKDWQAGWRTWCDKAAQWGRGRGGTSSHQPYESAKDKSRREWNERAFGKPSETSNIIDITGDSTRVG